MCLWKVNYLPGSGVVGLAVVEAEMEEVNSSNKFVNKLKTFI